MTEPSSPPKVMRDHARMVHAPEKLGMRIPVNGRVGRRTKPQSRGKARWDLQPFLFGALQINIDSVDVGPRTRDKVTHGRGGAIYVFHWLEVVIEKNSRMWIARGAAVSHVPSARLELVLQ